MLSDVFLADETLRPYRRLSCIEASGLTEERTKFYLLGPLRSPRVSSSYFVKDGGQQSYIGYKGQVRLYYDT